MIPRAVQQITYWPIYLALKFFFRYRVEGQENLKGLGDKPVIFVSNHASFLAGPICAAAMPRNLVAPVKFNQISFWWRKSILAGETPFLSLSRFLSLRPF